MCLCNHYFFLFTHQAEWEEADRDCRALVGDDVSGIVNLETQEEFGNLTKQLDESGNVASLYWLGGKYSGSGWVWSRGVAVGPWAPWAGGKPGLETRMSRITLSLTDGYQFKSQFNTVTSRFICEIKSDGGGEETEPEPCYEDNDLVIAVDSSGSIGEDKYEIALEFASKLAYTWADSGGNRVSVVIYSDVAETVIPLDNTLSQQEIREKAHGARYMNSGTNSHLGLDTAREEFEANPRQVPTNIVFMTDGGAANKNLLAAAIEKVKQAGIRTISVGIGPSIVESELLDIAQGNKDHVFTVNEFDKLLTLLKKVSQVVCGK